ncbi:IclR family transcriptional regulator [Consotaella aegiceratis]|uniref:IclR family transcriptional regulator n=1 Tax=Consotaella aegiceratis TaxID=3097961 RepID=UPI002F40C5C3
MARTPSAEAQAKHRIPVIERMMGILAALESMENGATILDLVAMLDVPQTTVYRILNTLATYDMVRRDGQGRYQLGDRLLSLASHVARDAGGRDLVNAAQKYMDRLTAELGESVKLSVADDDKVLVVATARGRRDYALGVSVGQRLPLHAGASGKLLLSYYPADVQDKILSRPLQRVTEATICDPEQLRIDLRRIRSRGYATDSGEGMAGIKAFAVPILDSGGSAIGALSVPFLAQNRRSDEDQIIAALLRTARELESELP